MIGQIYRKASRFRDAFTHLYDVPAPEFIRTRNLPTWDVRVAEVIMAAVGRRALRVQRPVYRFRVFFDPSDEVAEDLMLKVAGEILCELGAGDLQAVIAGSTSGRVRALYVIVNRVNPLTYTAWAPGWDMYRMMDILRQLERTHGLRPAPRDRRLSRGGERDPGGFRGPPDQLLRNGTRRQREVGTT